MIRTIFSQHINAQELIQSSCEQVMIEADCHLSALWVAFIQALDKGKDKKD